jgi:hypothetical protein
MPVLYFARNRYYDIACDETKNRIYLTLYGFWKDVKVVPLYRTDWEKVMNRVQPGFTVLADATRMKTQPADVQALHESVQLMLQNKGLGLAAKIVSDDDMADLQCDSMLRNTGLPVAKFSSPEAAESWLNSADVHRPAPLQR